LQEADLTEVNKLTKNVTGIFSNDYILKRINSSFTTRWNVPFILEEFSAENSWDIVAFCSGKKTKKYFST
jgi:hypothetical protein